jgi:peptidoglycan/xylan/chitin deacetylase (PgdA/CDA1 family)
VGATYLIRFDDLCPTMDWDVWDRIESLLIELDIRPILAVVPDNRDDFLVAGPAQDGFWERVRSWQDRGWTIGMHGYQHCRLTAESGIVGINDRSEFAGLSGEQQRQRLARGLAIFRSEHVDPQVWLAPFCSFDRVTVGILSALGIPVISDGLWLWPFREDGVTWIPHQIWRFHHMPFGVWTIGCHHNRWTEEQFAAFEADLRKYRDRIVDVPTVVRAYVRRRKSSLDRLAATIFLAAIKAKRGAREARLLKVPSDAY